MANHSPSNQADKELTTNDLADLLNVLTPVASKSHALGLQLGIPDSQILNIEGNYRKLEDHLYGILAARLKQQAPLKWSDIVRALRADSIREYGLARKIESQYMQLASLALQQGTVAHSSTDIPSWSPQLNVNACTSGVHTTSLAQPQPSANSVLSEPLQLPHAGYHKASQQQPVYCPPVHMRQRQQLSYPQSFSHIQQPPATSSLANTVTHVHSSTSSPQLLTHTQTAHPTSLPQPSASNLVSHPLQSPLARHQVVSQQQPLPQPHHPHTSTFTQHPHLLLSPAIPPAPPEPISLYSSSQPTRYIASNPQIQEQGVIRPENTQYHPSQYPAPHIGPISTPHSEAWDSPAAVWHTQQPACRPLNHTQQPTGTASLNNIQLTAGTAYSNIQQTAVQASPSMVMAHTHPPSDVLLFNQFIKYVTTIYKGSPVETNPTAVKWPPTPSKVYINLVCIDRGAKGLKREYDEVTEAMVCDGNVDVIYGKKWPIVMNEIFSGISGTDCKKLVLIEGAPGVGKSTFAWEFCRRWVRGELAQQYELVLLLRLRDERISKATMLKDLIYHSSDNVRQTVVTHLESTLGDNVLIILEGFDELSDEYRNTHSVFMQLIYGQLLPLATVMVTSRPWATCQLHKSCSHCLLKHIEILGFNKEQISSYIKSVSSESDVTGLNDYIKRHPQIGMCMYIPLNCAIVVTVYQESQDRGHALPTTLTELYTALTQILLIRYLRGHPKYEEGTESIKILNDLPVHPYVHRNFIELCKLAYSGIVESGDTVQLIFRNLPLNFDSLGFMDSVYELFVTQGTVSSHNFLHLTFQEFFAAVHISFMSPAEQMSMFKEHTGRLNVVLRFLAGLSKLSCFSRENLVQIFDSGEENGIPVPCDLTIDRFHVQWLFEAQNDDVTKYVLGNKKILFTSDKMLQMNYHSLGYCLAHSQCQWVLSLGAEIGVEEVKLLVAPKTSIGCRIIGLGGALDQKKSSMSSLLISAEALDLLFTELNGILEPNLLYLTLPKPCDCFTWPDLSALRHLKIILLNYATNWKLDCLLSHLLSVESFAVECISTSLMYSILSCENFVAVGKFITASKYLQKLYIGQGDVVIREDDRMEILTRALASNLSMPLEELRLLFRCRFTKNSAECLAQFVTHSVTLKCLTMRTNSIFNTHGLLELAKAIHHSSSLKVDMVGMRSTLKVDGDDEVKDLARLLEEYPDICDIVYWGYQKISRISKRGAIALSQAFNYYKSNIQNEGFPAPRHRNSFMNILQLSDSSIHDAGAIALAQALHHNSTVRRLDLSCNSICDDGAVALAQALRVNSTLRELNLTGNEGIGKEGFNHLVQALTINRSITNGPEVSAILHPYHGTLYHGLILPESCIRHISQCQQYHRVHQNILFPVSTPAKVRTATTDNNVLSPCPVIADSKQCSDECIRFRPFYIQYWQEKYF